MTSEKFHRQGQLNRNATILVICPLRSLIEDQLTEVQDLGILASSLPEAGEEDIKGGKFHNIFVARMYIRKELSVVSERRRLSQ